MTEGLIKRGEARGRAMKTGAAGGLLVVSAVLTGCFSSGEPEKSGEPKVVDVVKVAPAGERRTVSVSGRVRAAERASLSFEVAGKIEHLERDVGDSITAGQVLVRLDRTPYRLALESARTAQAEAGAHLEEQRLNVDRQSALRERNAISQSRLDSAEAALDRARARYESARVSVALAERDLAQTELTAPFDGSIGRRLAEPSERVTPNQAVYEVISDRHGFEVEARVPENLVGQLDDGSEHRVRFPALGDAGVDARVRHIGSQPLGSNTYPLWLALSTDEAPSLRSGMTAQVTLTVVAPDAADQSSFLVPLTAVRYPSKDRVEVLRLTEERLEAVPVTVEASRGERARVVGALREGDSIVARGVEFVSPGDQVTALSEGPERYY